MEPERNIEKLLRALTRRRRDQAGTPELHPANRRLLQAEVAKHYPKEKGGNLWRLFQIQPALFGLGVMAAVALLAALLLPALSGAKSKPKSVASRLAQSPEEYTPGAVAFSDGLKRPVPGGGAMPDMHSPAAEQSAVSIASTLSASTNPAPARTGRVLAMNGMGRPAEEVHPDRGGRGNAVMDASGALIAGEDSDKALPLPAAASIPEAGLQFQVSGSAGGGVGADKEKPARALLTPRKQSWVQEQRFVQATNLLTAGNGVKVDAGLSRSILADFKLEQRGAALRIIDGDGSVYVGSLQDVAAPSLTVVASGVAGKTTDRGSEIEFPFRVEGTNRTLLLNVIFTGNLIMPKQIQVGARDAGLTVPPPGTNSDQPVTRQRPYIVIKGTAVIGDARPIPVEAQMAQPSSR